MRTRGNSRDDESREHVAPKLTQDPLHRSFLTVTGRIKEIIIRNGENISAKEIEDVLYAHPLIADAAVISLPDARTGERCCAVVVPVRGAELDLAELVRHCAAAGLARQKLPEQLEIAAALPRNASGKVLKHELRRSFA